MISTLDRLSGYNPLRGLELDTLVSMIEQGERGYYADLQWLYRLILRRNATARAVRRKLQGALGRLDWDIKLRDDATGFDEATAEAQKKTLRAAYEQIRNLREAWAHLAMADILEFSHLVKVYAGAPGADRELQKAAAQVKDPWAILELRPVPRWLMCREGLFQPWTYNPEARQINRGEPLRGSWIVREVDDPAAEIFAFSHVKMVVSDADWDQFCDTYAVPPIFIEQPPNVPKEREGDYQRTAAAIVSDGRGSLPNGAKVHTVTAGTNDGSAFTSRLRYYREEIVLAGTGGILTTLDGNTGIGKGPAEEHDDTWLDIAAEVAAGVSAVFNEQLDLEILARAHPGEPAFAYFELQKPKKDTSPTIVLQDAKAAMDAGYQIDAKELSEKSGYTLTAKAAPVTPPSNPNEQQGAATPPNAESPAAAPTPETPGSATSPATPSPESAAAIPPGTGEPPAVEAVSPALAAQQPSDSAPIPEAANPKPSMAGEAKPSIVQAALADDLHVDARVFAPVKPYLDRIEAAVTAGDPDTVIAEIEAAIAALPEILGQLDVAAFTTAIEKATGPGALQGVRDAISARTAAKR